MQFSQFYCKFVGNYRYAVYHSFGIAEHGHSKFSVFELIVIVRYS